MNDDQKRPIVRDTTGLSPGYRFRWWSKYVGYTFFGPADVQPHLNPIEKLKHERAVRVLRAHESEGTPAPQDVIDAAREL
ncbi:hypothetical protein [Zhihengliuella salsuginis]|uniref:Integrase n=1 Tax=Zhihengliuella salsuginis TaxID=578222 RepID=A0ABQ3GMC4_9MICC|nr:hypothetical protein [Zhihengliuella salsuginis]GHD12477.1 hypothetical protein GCM10008096_27920 [Zhihengliuella salsuginis]